jgi:fatty acid/phospholipid biosynthesis enzyme
MTGSGQALDWTACVVHVAAIEAVKSGRATVSSHGNAGALMAWRGLPLHAMGRSSDAIAALAALRGTNRSCSASAHVGGDEQHLDLAMGRRWRGSCSTSKSDLGLLNVGVGRSKSRAGQAAGQICKDQSRTLCATGFVREAAISGGAVGVLFVPGFTGNIALRPPRRHREAARRKHCARRELA